MEYVLRCKAPAKLDKSALQRYQKSKLLVQVCVFLETKNRFLNQMQFGLQVWARKVQALAQTRHTSFSPYRHKFDWKVLPSVYTLSYSEVKRSGQPSVSIFAQLKGAKI